MPCDYCLNDKYSEREVFHTKVLHWAAIRIRRVADISHISAVTTCHISLELFLMSIFARFVLVNHIWGLLNFFVIHSDGILLVFVVSRKCFSIALAAEGKYKNMWVSEYSYVEVDERVGVALIRLLISSGVFIPRECHGGRVQRWISP